MRKKYEILGTTYIYIISIFELWYSCNKYEKHTQYGFIFIGII